MSQTDQLIPPEISAGGFHAALRRPVARGDIRNILEIGSSSGGGSTLVLIEGVLDGAKKMPAFSASNFRNPLGGPPLRLFFQALRPLLPRLLCLSRRTRL